jgi:hypothetical protein
MTRVLPFCSLYPPFLGCFGDRKRTSKCREIEKYGIQASRRKEKKIDLNPQCINDHQVGRGGKLSK